MKKILLTVDGYEVTLRSESISDWHYKATRKSVAKAVRKLRRMRQLESWLYDDLHIKLLTASENFRSMLYVSASLRGDCLHLGCCVFDEKTSKIIIKWALRKKKAS